jgi:hypothetical protein
MEIRCLVQCGCVKAGVGRKERIFLTARRSTPKHTSPVTRALSSPRLHAALYPTHSCACLFVALSIFSFLQQKLHETTRTSTLELLLILTRPPHPTHTERWQGPRTTRGILLPKSRHAGKYISASAAAPFLPTSVPSSSPPPPLPPPPLPPPTSLTMMPTSG